MNYEEREEDEAEGEGEGEGEEGDEEVPQQVADLAQAQTPNALRGIRACKRCGLLKTLDQFINEGCENCPFLDMVCYVFCVFCVIVLFVAPCIIYNF